MGNILFGIPKKSNRVEKLRRVSHPEDVFAHNLRMKKSDIRQLLTQRLTEEMDRAGINQQALAQKARISVSHLSEIRRGISSVTVDLLNDLAYALGIDAWELIIDQEETRRAAIERAISRQPMGGSYLPPHAHQERAPKMPAHRSRKKRPKSDSSAGESS